MTERPVVPSAAGPDGAHQAATTAPAGISRDEVERLLGLISQLRTDMTSDLSLAAAALDADAPGVASDVLAGGHTHLTGASRRALETASPLRAPAIGTPGAARGSGSPRRGRLRRLARAAGIAAAAPALAVTAAAAAVVAPPAVQARPVPSSLGRPDVAVATAASRIQALATTALRAPQDNADVTRAADAVQASLQPLIAAAQADPQSARQAVALLLMEQDVLMTSRPAVAGRLLRETQRLLHRLRVLSPGGLVPAAPVAPLPSATPSPDRDKATPSRSAGPTPDGSASPKPTSSPRPSSSPSPRPSPSSSPRPSGSPSPSPESTLLLPPKV